MPKDRPLLWKVTAGCITVGVLQLGCGKSPTRPSSPSGGGTITVKSSSDLLHLGASETFTAMLTTASGTTQTVSVGTWGSDAPTVAQVDGSGQVTGIASGEATIFVDAQGVRGTKRIRILPNYQGSWIGSYVIESCSSTGQFFRYACSNGDGFAINSVFPMALQLTQAGDVVTGNTALGSVISGQFSVAVSPIGDVQITTFGTSSGSQYSQGWSLQSTVAGRITGVLNVVITHTEPGSATFRARLMNVNRQ